MISLLYIYRLIYNISKVEQQKKGGKNILDRYRIITLICEHEHTVVWLAEHRTLRTKRIIKGIRRSSPVHDLLAAEAATLTGLSHPGIPSVFDVDGDDQFTYIIEEFIEGETLKSFYLKQDVGEEQLLDHLEQICSVLEYLQDRSVRLIRLDLKPENIMISDRVRIIDLGTACREGEKTDLRVFSAGFSAPEQKRGELPGKESDIYSLGKLILFMTQHSAVSNRTEKKLLKIAERCTCVGRDERVGSCVIVRKMLKGATERKHASGRSAGAEKAVKRIAVLGLAPGCGTTHVAVCLASVLAADMPVVFRQKDCDEALKECFVRERLGRRRKGVVYATPEGSRSCRPGSFGELPAVPCGSALVADLGGNPAICFKEATAAFDLIIIVGGGAAWRRNDFDFLERMIAQDRLGRNCRVIINPAGKSAAQNLPQGLKAFCFPFEDDPFSPGPVTKKLIGKIVG